MLVVSWSELPRCNRVIVACLAASSAGKLGTRVLPLFHQWQRLGSAFGPTKVRWIYLRRVYRTRSTAKECFDADARTLAAQPCAVEGDSPSSNNEQATLAPLATQRTYPLALAALAILPEDGRS
jgi:hypothetical protein